MRVMQVQPVAFNFKDIPVGSFFKFMFSSENDSNTDAIKNNIFFKTEEIEVTQSKYFFYNAVNITTGEPFYFLDNDVGMVYPENNVTFNFNVSAISLSNPTSVEKKKRKINISPKEKPISFKSIYTGNIFSIVSDSNNVWDKDYNKDVNYFDFFSTFFYIRIPTTVEKYYNNYDSENTYFNTTKINAVNLCTGNYTYVHEDAQVINFSSDCVLSFRK